MSNIKVTWKAFGDRPELGKFISSVEFETPLEHNEEDLLGEIIVQQNFCEKLFAQTNLYSGNFWDIIEPLLSKSRTHTSLSVGDEIEIVCPSCPAPIIYKVADCGFETVLTAVKEA